MIVLIDSGNTRLKVGWIRGGGVAGGMETSTTGAPSAAALPVPSMSSVPSVAAAFDNTDADALSQWLAALPVPPRLALGTNVAGAARAGVIEAALKRHGCAVQWVKPQAQALGLVSRYKNPGQLGADRWASMLGVFVRLPSEHRPAFLLACFGTATTLDTVSAAGLFEGGLILPGPAMMRKSLAAGTADLPLAHGSLEDFPVDTHQAISSGVAAAQAGAVLRQWLAGIRRYGVAPEIFVAGGGWDEVAAETERLLADAAVAMGRLPPVVRVIDNPVLDGLASLAADMNLGSL